MKSLAKIFFYLLISVLAGALVAPWIYLAVQGWDSSHWGSLSSLVASLQSMPFHRYFSRSVQVSALILLWPMVRWLGMYRLADFSLYSNNHAWSDLCFGIISALLPLGLLEIFFIWKGWYALTASFHPASLLKFLAAASLVALLEEFFFRGLLLGVSRRAFGDRGAFWFTSLFFAALHFLSMPHGGITNVDWSSGLKLCIQVGQGLPIMPLFLGAFVNLTILGMILAWVTLRTHSLWLAIGLHAGWIFCQQSFNQSAHYAISPPDLMHPWIGLPQVHGLVPVGLLYF